jgi:hypothetical protein
MRIIGSRSGNEQGSSQIYDLLLSVSFQSTLPIHFIPDDLCTSQQKNIQKT